MKPIIFLAGTPEYKFLKENQPLIEKALLHSFQIGYQCGESNAINNQLKEVTDIGDMIEETEKLFERNVKYGTLDSVKHLILED
jgi:hypothetical protein